MQWSCYRLNKNERQYQSGSIYQNNFLSAIELFDGHFSGTVPPSITDQQLIDLFVDYSDRWLFSDQHCHLESPILWFQNPNLNTKTLSFIMKDLNIQNACFVIFLNCIGKVCLSLAAHCACINVHDLINCPWSLKDLFQNKISHICLHSSVRYYVQTL